MKALVSLMAVVALAALSPALWSQAVYCNYEMTLGWDETAAAQALGGGTGPEDIAWNPVTGRLYVLHDQLGSSTDLILEYTLQGALTASAATTPGTGGLCAIPNSPNLLLASGSQITEIDAGGNPVPGGVSVNISGYGNIQDLDFDPSGALWVHNGNTGDFSIVDLATGTATTQFTTSFGSQAMAFTPIGNIAVCVAFFNAGGFSTGTYVELDPVAGQIQCYGGPAFGGFLSANDDPACAFVAPAFTIVNGMTWIGETNELAITSFNAVGGVNVARFAPESTALVGLLGTDGIRGDGFPFRLTASGDAVIGGTGFQLRVDNVWPGDTVLWGVSTARDCANPGVGTNGSAIYLDLSPSSLFYWTTINAPGSSIVVNVPTAGITPPLFGFQLYTQFAGTDLGAPGFPTIITRAARVRFGFQ